MQLRHIPTQTNRQTGKTLCESSHTAELPKEKPSPSSATALSKIDTCRHYLTWRFMYYMIKVCENNFVEHGVHRWTPRHLDTTSTKKHQLRFVRLLPTTAAITTNANDKHLNFNTPIADNDEPIRQYDIHDTRTKKSKRAMNWNPSKSEKPKHPKDNERYVYYYLSILPSHQQVRTDNSANRGWTWTATPQLWTNLYTSLSATWTTGRCKHTTWQSVPVP